MKKSERIITLLMKALEGEKLSEKAMILPISGSQN